MNLLSVADLREKIQHKMRFQLRSMDFNRQSQVFSMNGERGSIGRIYVINLDRRLDRWQRVSRELSRFRDRHGNSLRTLTRRFSATDARYLGTPTGLSDLRPYFTLAEQLLVDPNPLLNDIGESASRRIAMTKQEVAVALSHIEVWRAIADSDVENVLILEDDIFFKFGFVRALDKAWSYLTSPDEVQNFDLLYLAFKDLRKFDHDVLQPKRRLSPGVWEASAYVLTVDGARNLLSRLPAHGPIDLWLNLQFPHLRVFTAQKPMIEQRIDEPSTNVYSVLPVLSELGVITREKPLAPGSMKIRGPIIATGPAGSGLTALAKALSMMGFTCISDIETLPDRELRSLKEGSRGRVFTAYVNVGCLDVETLRSIGSANPKALFILTCDAVDDVGEIYPNSLHLPLEAKDKWAALSQFLKLDYPTFPFPTDADLGYRVLQGSSRAADLKSKPLKFDKSPWILSEDLPSWNGVIGDSAEILDPHESLTYLPSDEALNRSAWSLREDTFPSNLALFQASNFSEFHGQSATLTLREEKVAVRELTAAAISSRDCFRFGHFSASIRPSNIPGVITGVFLHRNSPRQEIDIEFLGKDTRKMLTNVYYNPGPDGTRLEYGYRGTPIEIDLGFDASTECHLYEIEWYQSGIRWKVDGEIVHERHLWDPTPIPDLPLEFNVNVWNSRSQEFAGTLNRDLLPARVELRSLSVRSMEVVPRASQEDPDHQNV